MYFGAMRAVRYFVTPPYILLLQQLLTAATEHRNSEDYVKIGIVY